MSGKKVSIRIGAGASFQESVITDVQEAKGNAANAIATTNDHTAQLADIVYNVKSLGAKGDGVTDDTLAIKNAIDYVDSIGGGTVYLPKGVYRFSKHLEMGDYTTFQGAGIDITTLKMVDNVDLTGTLDENPDLVKEVCVSWKKNRNLKYGKICDLTIDLNCQNNRHWNSQGKDFTQWTGLDYEDRNQFNCISLDWFHGRIPPETVIIERVKCSNSIRNGINGSPLKNLFVSDCIFENSDVDHLIYVLADNKNTHAIFNNITLSGYARVNYIQSAGCTFNNVTIKDIRQNPTGYDLSLVMITKPQSTWVTNTITNLSINIDSGFIPSTNFALFNNLTSLTVKNTSILFNDDVVYNADFYLFSLQNSTGSDTSNVLVLDGCIVKNAPNNFSLFNVAIPQISTTVKNVDIFYKNPSNLNGVASIMSLNNANATIYNMVLDNVNFNDGMQRGFIFNSPASINKLSIINSKFNIPTDYYMIDGNFSALKTGIIFMDNVYLKTIRNNKQYSQITYKYVFTLDVNSIPVTIQNLISTPSTTAFYAVGDCVFNKTLVKPVWCKTSPIYDINGVVTTPAVWVDATGTTV